MRVPRAGEKYRVKKTPLLRKYGLRTHGAFQEAADNRAWPGDIGTVEITVLEASKVTQLLLRFSRGRSRSLGHRYQGEDEWRLEEEVLRDLKKLTAKEVATLDD